MQRIHLASAAIVLVTFVAGLATGAGLHASFAAGRPPHGRPGGPPPGPGLPPYLRELGLSPEQETRARAIFERHRADMDAVMQQSLPRIRVINERVEQELRDVLTPEQRDRLDALRRRRPPGPPPPGDPGGAPLGAVLGLTPQREHLSCGKVPGHSPPGRRRRHG